MKLAIDFKPIQKLKMILLHIFFGLYQGKINQDYKMNLNGDKLCSSIKICVRSGFPEKDRKFSHLEEDVLFGLVDDMCAKVFANDTVPSRATAFVHLIFEIS